VPPTLGSAILFMAASVLDVAAVSGMRAAEEGFFLFFGFGDVEPGPQSLLVPRRLMSYQNPRWNLHVNGRPAATVLTTGHRSMPQPSKRTEPLDLL